MNKIIKNSVYLMLSLLIGIMFWNFKIPSFAEEKNISVDIPSGYIEADFYFSFADDKSYEVTIIDPYENPSVNTIKGTEGVVSLTPVEEGTYYIRISAKGTVSLSSSPRVELIKGETTSETSGISVSSAVSGLKTWFENGIFHAKWDDTNIGKVIIQITDPTTMEMIKNETINATEYETELPDEINSFVFYIVPASNSKINGSGVSYTINVIKDIGCTCDFPEKDLYNVSTYEFKVNVNNQTKIKVFENGAQVYEDTFADAGIYPVEIPLNDNENNLVVKFFDENDNMNSFEYTVYKDIIAPKFTMNEVDEVTNMSNVNLSGSVTDVDKVYINEIEVPVDEYGRFSYDLSLKEGDNNVTIQAIDEAENITSINYTITYRRSNTFSMIIVVFVIVGSVIFGIVYMLKPKKEKTSPKKNEPKTKPLKEKTKKEKPQKNKKEKTAKITDENLVTKKEKNEIKGFFVTLAFLTVCTITLLTKGIVVTSVASGSMEKTLKTGNFVVYNRLSYVFHDVARGDIICFRSKELNETMAKRVIGIAGDTISFADGYIVLNGEKTEEEYINSDIETNALKEFTVPDDCVFVLGDNREDSYDSRFWNNPYIKISDIYGKYIGQIKKIF